MRFFQNKSRNKPCYEWFDFTTLMLLKAIFLLWALSILGIFLKMFSITRAFKIAIPLVCIFLIFSFISKKPSFREKAVVLFLFTMILFLIAFLIDHFAQTRYFTRI